MWFNSKKGILEHCGKDGKDVRWLDRAIKNGKIIELEGEYCTIKDYIKEIEDSESDSIQTIISLKKRIEELESKKENKSESEVSDDSSLVEELKEHLRYAWERRDVAYKSIMFIVGAYTKGDIVKEKEMLKKIGYTDDVNEGKEMKWAKDNGIIN